jgi:hypothetical protein
MQGIEEFFKEFDWSKLAIVALFALPGFISLRVWSLIFPTSEQAPPKGDGEIRLSAGGLLRESSEP